MASPPGHRGPGAGVGLGAGVIPAAPGGVPSPPRPSAGFGAVAQWAVPLGGQTHNPRSRRTGLPVSPGRSGHPIGHAHQSPPGHPDHSDDKPNGRLYGRGIPRGDQLPPPGQHHGHPPGQKGGAAQHLHLGCCLCRSGQYCRHPGLSAAEAGYGPWRAVDAGRGQRGQWRFLGQLGPGRLLPPRTALRRHHSPATSGTGTARPSPVAAASSPGAGDLSSQSSSKQHGRTGRPSHRCRCSLDPSGSLLPRCGQDGAPLLLRRESGGGDECP